MNIRPMLLVAALASGGTQLGCAGMVKDAAREATPAVVAGAVAALAQPETQREILAMAEAPRVQALTSQVTAGLVDGALDTLEDPARAKRVEELSARLVESAVTTLDTPEHRARLDVLVGQLASSAGGALIDTTLAHALDEQAQAQMRGAMKVAVSELIGAVFESVRTEMGTPEERSKALGEAAHEVTKGATLGFQDAIDEAKRQRATGEMTLGEGSLLDAVGNAGATGSRIVWILSVGLSLIAIVLALGLIWAMRKNRSRGVELAQRDEALLLLTEAIKSTEAKPWSSELREAIKASMRDRRGGDHIRKVLREKRGLRLGAGEMV